ncbi:MAG: sulfatase-like hydrolase/transferase, partial [Deltaproteobacteria bacterium]|nr:sulfatase-like hydrolase/transferase [Deltaproteobacteria bacterium]
NGSPGNLRGRKGEVLEGGQRVPMIARWPGRIPAGGVSDEIAMNIDVFPTLLGLAGIPLPEDRIVDGADLIDVFEKNAPSPHDLLFYFPTMGGEPAGARNARFKYLASTGDLGRDKSMLSDVHRDQEGHNLIRRFPEDGKRLGDAVARLAEEIESNPRGWR